MASSKDIYEAKIYAAGMYAAGIWRGIGVDIVPEPEPEPTPSPQGQRVGGTGGINVMEIGWHDKPWIRRRDRELAKSMVEDIESIDRNKRKRVEAIVVALMLLR